MGLAESTPPEVAPGDVEAERQQYPAHQFTGVCTLHLQLSPPGGLDFTAGRGEKARAFFEVLRDSTYAKLGDFYHPKQAQRVPWNEDIPVHLTEENSIFLVQLATVRTNEVGDNEEEVIVEIALPYANCTGSLRDLGLRTDGTVLTLNLGLRFGSLSNCHREDLGRTLMKLVSEFSPNRPNMELRISQEPALSRLPPLMVPPQGQESECPTFRTTASMSTRFKPDEEAAAARPWTERLGLWWSTPQEPDPAVDVKEPEESLQPELPDGRIQIMTLELENAALQQRLAAAANQEYVPQQPLHWRRLEKIRQENVRLNHEKSKILQKLDDAKEIMAQNRHSGLQLKPMNYGQALSVFKRERTEYLNRQTRIKQGWEEKIHQMRNELTRLQKEIDGEANPIEETIVTEANKLQRELHEASARLEALGADYDLVKNTTLEDHALADQEVRRLMAVWDKQEAEILWHQQALRERDEAEQGSSRQKDLRQSISNMYDTLDAMKEEMRDWRVRAEFEVRELKCQRDRAKDAWEAANDELKNAKAMVEALQNVQPEIDSELIDVRLKLDSLRTESARLGEEHTELLALEQERHASIEELERLQTELIENLSLLAAGAVPVQDCDGNGEMYISSLQAKADELGEAVWRSECACEEQRQELEELERRAREAREEAEMLKEQYNSLQRLADERMLNGSGPSTPASAGRF